MSNQNNKEDGCIPTPVVNQLIEHTAGGFILFYFNANDGQPENMMTFDSPAHCLALQKYIADWSIALSDLNVESARHNIESCIQDDPDDSDVI
jgi:hypothetical protein